MFSLNLLCYVEILLSCLRLEFAPDLCLGEKTIAAHTTRENTINCAVSFWEKDL